MRNQILLLVGMMIGFTSYGQFNLGINTSFGKVIGEAESVSLVDNRGYEVYNLQYQGQDDFYSIGLSGYAEKGNLYFMTAVNFRSATYNFQIMKYGESAKGFSDTSIETQTIHIPVTAGFSYNKFRLGVGPDFNMVIDSNEDLSQYYGMSYQERSLKTGFHFALGYDPIPNIKLGLEYEFAFYNITDDYKFGGKRLPINATPKMLNFTLAFIL